MPYVTRDHILAHIPEPILRDALDDDGDGREDPGLLDKIIEDAGNECDGLVAARYTVPFNPVPVPIQRAAHAFVLDLIYSRRRVQDTENPFRKEANQWRDVLREIGAGKRQLDASQAVVISAAAGGQPNVPGRVPMGGSSTTY
jgi:phage gp36-like protein